MPDAPTEESAAFHEGTAAKARSSIVIYGMNYSPEPIGVGRYSGELGDYLAKQGYDVSVVAAVPHYPGWKVRDNFSNTYQSSRAGGVHVIRCPLVLRSDMRGIWRVLAPFSFAISSALVAFWTILLKKPATVLCIEPTLMSVPAGLLAAWMTGAYTVLHVQDLEVDAAFAVGHMQGGLIRRVAVAIEMWLMARFDLVITISSAMKRGIAAKGIANSRIGLIRNWVDLSKFHNIQNAGASRAAFDLSESDFIVQYAGNIGAKQALDVLLDAAVRLESVPGIVFVIAGEGPDRKRLEAKYGHLTNVRFMGVQPEATFCEFLAMADLHVIPQAANTADLVLPSKLGGMLASGKPVIAMADRDTELGEFLGQDMIVLPPGDVAALAAAIVHQQTTRQSYRDKALALAAQLNATVILKNFAAMLFR